MGFHFRKLVKSLKFVGFFEMCLVLNANLRNLYGGENENDFEMESGGSN
jgi:hypothetical protein